MTAHTIPLQDKAAQRVYSDYLKRIERTLQPLGKSEREDVLMEWNSHIYEALQRNGSNSEIDALLDITEKLGAPEEVLKPLLAEKKMEQAVRSFNPIHIFKALVLNIGNGIAYVIFALLYLLLFTFGFLIVAKLVNPKEVGMYFADGSFTSLGYMTNTDGYTEVLGHWFIPAMLIAAGIFYFLITLGLRLKRRLNRKNA